MRRLLLSLFTFAALTIPLLAYTPIQRLVANQITISKWLSSSFPLVWRLNTTLSANITGDRTVDTVVRAAFQAWDDIATADISATAGPVTAVTDPANDGQNVVSTVPSDSVSFSGALAFALTWRLSDATIVECDIMVNPDPALPYSTSLVTPADKFDLQAVLTHEIGHLLGLDHAGLASATMFPTAGRGVSYARAPSSDDAIGLSTVYPVSGFQTSRGSVQGVVKTQAGSPVYGAFVVVVNSNGHPVATTISDPLGSFKVDGLDAGIYSIYAEPLDSPIDISNVPTLGQIYVGQTPLTTFTTRFRP